MVKESPAFATRSSATRSGRVDGPLAGIGHAVRNIGEHTGEILSELGYDARRIAQLAEIFYDDGQSWEGYQVYQESKNTHKCVTRSSKNFYIFGPSLSPT